MWVQFCLLIKLLQMGLLSIHTAAVNTFFIFYIAAESLYSIILMFVSVFKTETLHCYILTTPQFEDNKM